MDNPIIHELPEFIASIVPEDYVAVNLGSGDATETYKFTAAASAKGKQGIFLNVDPFISQPNVLKITS